MKLVLEAYKVRQIRSTAIGQTVGFRLYGDRDFQCDGEFVVSGKPNEGAPFFFSASCPVVGVADTAGVTVPAIQLPQIELITTTDSDSPDDASYTAAFLLADGTEVIWKAFRRFRVPPDLDPLTWAALRAYNLSLEAIEV